jgi:ABC-2 type transport system ATP-binding protein
MLYTFRKGDGMETAIKIHGLTKVYGDFTALSNLNLDDKKGEVIGFLGPNGAGKTTTIRMILGLIKPTAGTVEILGIDSQKQKIEAHKKVAYVPGDPNLWPSLTGEETLHLLAKTHIGADEAYQKQLMHDFAFEPSKKVRTYSKGNKQKINLIAALASRAEILIFDEPTAGLDPLMERVFRQHVEAAKARGQTVFLSSHILEEVESLCDRVAVIKEGKLVELGTLEELRHLSAVTIDATFPGTPPDVHKIKNVTNVKVTGKHLHVQLQGDVSELLTVIAKAKPQKLLSREPSLEELFLSLYGDKESK